MLFQFSQNYTRNRRICIIKAVTFKSTFCVRPIVCHARPGRPIIQHRTPWLLSYPVSAYCMEIPLSCHFLPLGAYKPKREQTLPEHKALMTWHPAAVLTFVHVPPLCDHSDIRIAHYTSFTPFLLSLSLRFLAQMQRVRVESRQLRNTD